MSLTVRIIALTGAVAGIYKAIVLQENAVPARQAPSHPPSPRRRMWPRWANGACSCVWIATCLLLTTFAGQLAHAQAADAVPLATAPTAETAPTVRPVADRSAPWRLSRALGVPTWLRVGIEQRSRWERLGDDFRAAATGDAMALSMRTLATVEANFAAVSGLIEIADARAYATAQTLLANTTVNPLDLLQGQLTLRHRGLLHNGDEARLTVGRMTVDLGSRRLIARNEFRNTINAFDGMDGQWTTASGWTLRVLAMAPVLRRPTAPKDLAANVLQADVAQTNAWLGVLWLSGQVMQDTQIELFVAGLHESDGLDTSTTNRRLVTPTLRILRAPKAGQLDGQVEASVQVGRSRASTQASDTVDLAHLATALHVQVGYRWPQPAQPRLAAVLDYGSGDVDPKDGRNGRFDTLFGARRFELGPTGLYGALARSNLISPGLRAEVTPTTTTDAMIAWRAAWVDEAKDAWTRAGLRDPTGGSGRAIGHQVEIRLRWHIWPRNLSLDVGGAALWRTGMAATLGADRGDPLYTYAQLTGTL